MPATKTDKNRQPKVDAFKKQAKTKAAQQSIPKTHLIPETEWGTTDILDLRGDLLQTFESQFAETYQHLEAANTAFQNAGQILHMIISDNVTKDKIKLKYKWNNGEAATEQEIVDFKEKMKQFRELREKQLKELEKGKQVVNTGLVDVNGAPLENDQEELEDARDIPIEYLKDTELDGKAEAEEKEFKAEE